MEKLFEIIFSPVKFNFGEWKADGPAILVIPLIIATILVFTGSLIRPCRDAKRRNKNVFLAVAFILFAGWPLSILWWLWLRPAPVPDERKL